MSKCNLQLASGYLGLSKNEATEKLDVNTLVKCRTKWQQNEIEETCMQTLLMLGVIHRKTKGFYISHAMKRSVRKRNAMRLN